MEAIKKKMQAMKVEKDNLMDRCDNCEQVDVNFSFHLSIGVNPCYPTLDYFITDRILTQSKAFKLG